MLELTLPYPPSLNHYWRCNRGRFHISTEGKVYRDNVSMICLNSHCPTLIGKLKIEILSYPPDNRRRDLDNTLKANLDALQHAGCYEDDSQISNLHIRRMDIVKGGKVEVKIEEI